MLAIASLSLREAASRRIATIVFVVTLLAIALATWGFAKLAESVHPAVVATGLEAAFLIALGFVFSVVLAIGAAFVAAPAVAGDVAGGLVLAILPRPLTRAEYVLGKWLGTSALVVAYTFVAGGIGLAAIDLVTGYLPPHPVLALTFFAAEAVTMLTIALALGTRLPAIGAGILTVACFGAAWIAGMAGAIARQLGNDGVLHASTVVGLVVPTDVLWRGAVFELEPVAYLAAGQAGASMNPLSVPSPPTIATVVWIVLWFAAVLWTATAVFARRDV